MTIVHGLVLAAGAGTRMGLPKALITDADEPWLRRAVRVLRDGGCDRATVVLGAVVDEALALLDGLGADVVVAHDWAEGMSASLRTGLRALEPGDADAALVTLIDLPDLTPEVVRRVVGAGADRSALARAAYAGTPGHPVLLGRDHWADVTASVTGDAGARDYLAEHSAYLVECGDLATGRDVDTPDERAKGASGDRRAQ